jgi:hypothetical protein
MEPIRSAAPRARPLPFASVCAGRLFHGDVFHGKIKDVHADKPSLIISGQKMTVFFKPSLIPIAVFSFFFFYLFNIILFIY